jgi:hypothetical protein
MCKAEIPSGVSSPLSAECSKRTTKFVLDTHRYTNQVGQRCCGWHSRLKGADRHRWTEQSHLLFSICFFHNLACPFPPFGARPFLYLPIVNKVWTRIPGPPFIFSLHFFHRIYIDFLFGLCYNIYVKRVRETTQKGGGNGPPRLKPRTTITHQKFFEKLFKNLLTNPQKCGIIIM